MSFCLLFNLNRGMEPLVVAVIASTVTGALSAFGGAALYTALWRLFNKETAKVMDAVCHRAQLDTEALILFAFFRCNLVFLLVPLILFFFAART